MAHGVHGMLHAWSMHMMSMYSMWVAHQLLLYPMQIMGDNVEGARELLRSGAFSGLRENIRALGEYAVINGKVKDAAPLVNGFFRALEEYDILLYSSIRFV